MVSKKLPRKAKIKERQFMLRLPEHQAIFIEHLVDLGMFKSQNDSIIKIISAFISDLEKAVEKSKK